MIPDRYNVENLLKVLNEPSKSLVEIRRLIRTSFDFLYHNKQIGKKIFEMRHQKPTKVMEKDWDNLIILDACRWDMFQQVNTIEGKSKGVVSGASHSGGFIEYNFKGEKFHDTVYVTANIFGAQIDDDVFHDTLLTFPRDAQQPRDKDFRTPDQVKNLAIEAFKKYPNKRLIIHFMQPHAPHFSPIAREVRKCLKKRESLHFNRWEGKKEYEEGYIQIGDLNRAARRGYISPELLKNIYKESIETVLTDVKALLQEIDGKTVITSDHGELLGETEHFLLPARYNHPRGIYMEELRIVPWMTICSKDRRNIEKDPPIRRQNVDDPVINEKLEALGYK